MVFSNEKLPNMFNKIIDEINQKTQNKNTIEIGELRKIIIKFRLTKDDTDFFIQYLKEHNIIDRKGRMIYILDKPTTEETKNKPGRPTKLTPDEKQYIMDNYIPGKYGVRKLANEINKNRDEPISHVALYKYHIC